MKTITEYQDITGETWHLDSDAFTTIVSFYKDCARPDEEWAHDMKHWCYVDGIGELIKLYIRKSSSVGELISQFVELYLPDNVGFIYDLEVALMDDLSNNGTYTLLHPKDACAYLVYDK